MQTLSELPLVAGAMPAQLLRQVRRRHKALQRLRKLRQQARDEIERLIQFLDDSDLDPDLEADGADEPSLGFQECFPGFLPAGSVLFFPPFPAQRKWRRCSE